MKAAELAEEDPGALPLPGDVPGVFVREGEGAGLYFLEVVLGNADPDSEMPLVLALHGRGDRPRVPGGPFMGLPVPVRIVVPRAPLTLGGGYAWLPLSVVEGKPGVLAAFLDTMGERLADLIDEVRAVRPSTGRTIVTGFSQGGLLAFALAVHHPRSVGWAFPVAGWLPPALVPGVLEHATTYPVIRAMHGTDDEIMPIEPTREAVGKLAALGIDAEIVEFPGVGHETTAGMNELFHAWLVEAVEVEAALAPDAPGDAPEPFETP
jgi:phospholipase/carboxylesterase